MHPRCLSLISALFLLAGFALAQVPYDPSPFSAIGKLQGATVAAPSDVLSGGTLTVNGITMVVPKNLLVTMPSITVSWAELFTSAGSLSLGISGDVEVSVLANRVGGQYIVGIVYIFQELLHTSSGFITAIDYATGELRVGGDPASPASGARIIVNDPVGRFGLVHGQAPLFAADTDNPSIRASTGFPLCVPRTDPAITDDPLCPRKNRPLNAAGKPSTQFNFGAPPVAAGQPDPNFFAPLTVGDYIVWSGVSLDGGLWSAYSIEANLGLYTAPGTAPVYLTIDVAQWGIVGNPAGEVAETRIQGYTTDETQNIEVFAIDVDPCTGAETERVLAVVVPRPAGRRGQWRYRPNADIAPATREVGARVQAGAGTNGNGIATGRFVQPVMDDGFVFPELNTFGGAEIVYEFNLLQHLAQGSGPWLGGIPGGQSPSAPVVGQLDPWPGAAAPARGPACSAAVPLVPKANAGPDQSVASGAAVTLSGRSDTTNVPESSITYLWQQIVGAGPAVTLSGANGKTATFTAPAVIATLSFNLTTSTAAGSTSDQVTINVTGPVTGPDTITIVSFSASNSKGVGQLNVVARTTVLDGSSTLTVEALDPNVAATPMQYSGKGDGTFSILINTKKPKSFIVRSSRGASVTQNV